MATWHLGYHLSICSRTQENQEKPASRWPVAGPSGPCPLDSSPVTIKSHMAHTHNTITLTITTIHTITTMHMENYNSRIINSVLQRNSWSASRFGRFTSEERTSSSYCTREWVIWTLWRRIPSPCWESNLSSSAV